MLGTIGWIVAAYVVTFAENVLQMKGMRALLAGKRFRTAAIDAVYDVVLLIDVWFIIEKWWLVFPIVVASFHGSYYAFPERLEAEKTSAAPD
ncbi:MAG: hypothetical protein HUU03_12250 [Planctomycetaceae bacterium]|nr:hypothetical protein [Planctomycetaceae bacterium]